VAIKGMFAATSEEGDNKQQKSPAILPGFL
jgi:hypothetical protein